MPERQDLEQRVQELEKQLAQLKQHRMRGVRFRSSLRLGDIPLVVVAAGPDLESGELRGHARGIVAIGDIATGVLAFGGLARGVLAFGGLALGVFSFGGLSIGALVAIGGLAVGSVAVGGGAVGGVAIGGGAAGYFACGGEAVGKHAISPDHQDTEALIFFRRYGIEGLCRGTSRDMTSNR